MRLLRGRVAIKPLVEQRSHFGIWIPNVTTDRDNKPSLGRGVVVDFGPPSFTSHTCRACHGSTSAHYEHATRCSICKGAGKMPTEKETERGFEVGSEVLYIGQHVSRRSFWKGEEVAMVSQEEVVAVVERANG